MAQISSVDSFNFSRMGQVIKNGVDRIMNSVLESMRIEGRVDDDYYYDDDDCDDEYIDEDYDEAHTYEEEYDKNYRDDKFTDLVCAMPPKKAFIAYDLARDKTVIKLYDNTNKRYYKKEADGDRRIEYRNIILENTTENDLKREDVIDISVLNGSGKRTSVKKKSIKALKPDAREQVARALVSMQNDSRRERTYIDNPVFPKDSKFNFSKISYPLFEAKLLECDSNFNIEPVFENLNSSFQEDIFNDDTIDEVLIGEEGTNITLKTKDGLRAFLNFKNGRREITSVKPQEDGLDIILLDNNGPLLKGRKKENKT